MTDTPRILAFSGSTRSDSYNKKLVKIAAAGARAAGADVTYLDLRELPMPLYDGDLETQEGLPPNAKKFRQMMIDHQGLLIASPEYNSSFSGVLKNAIDWASRPAPGEPPLGCFVGKVAAIMSTSTGGFGGVRGLLSLRSLLGNLRVLVLPEQVTISHASDAFSAEGDLKDLQQRQSVEQLGATLVHLLMKLSA
jgi:chromate reductase